MPVKARKTVILLTLGFLVGISLLLYPAFSNFWNARTQSRAIVIYESVLEHLEPADYTAIFQAAYDYNDALREVEFPIRDFEQVPGYYEDLKIAGTSIIGYVKIDRIGVELPVNHGTTQAVLVVARDPDTGRFMVIDSNPPSARGRLHRVYFISLNKQRTEIINSTFKEQLKGSKVLQLYQWYMLEELAEQTP